MKNSKYLLTSFLLTNLVACGNKNTETKESQKSSIIAEAKLTGETLKNETYQKSDELIPDPFGCGIEFSGEKSEVSFENIDITNFHDVLIYADFKIQEVMFLDSEIDIFAGYDEKFISITESVADEKELQVKLEALNADLEKAIDEDIKAREKNAETYRSELDAIVLLQEKVFANCLELPKTEINKIESAILNEEEGRSEIETPIDPVEGYNLEDSTLQKKTNAVSDICSIEDQEIKIIEEGLLPHEVEEYYKIDGEEFNRRSQELAETESCLEATKILYDSVQNLKSK